MFAQHQAHTPLTRVQIKANAKHAMTNQRNTSIGIVAIFMLVSALAAAISPLLVRWIPSIGGALSSAMPFFVMMPLAVGMGGSFLKICTGQPVTIQSMFDIALFNYIRKVGGMAWLALWAMLWSLLFVIPGIIKAIAYSMTPYILAAHHNVDARTALKLSMRMTQGHKGELFMFYLSFIGWLLLSALTFGILYIVHVGPYMNTAMAGYFVELRSRAIASGAIQAHELDAQPVA
ncbi:MAG: DUF975 family protein [Oscillospiraceae bacterium]|nr:DUF975 family protein [Oscillospiraceae bacterium]